MMDIMSQGSKSSTGIERDSMNLQVIELTGCAWHPVEHIILGNADIWIQCGKNARKGVFIPLTVWIRH